MINITYAITVCNELKELTKLLNFLQPKLKEEDEILIQYDDENVTKEVLDYLNIISKIHQNYKVVGFPLNNDFASFKNNLKLNSNGNYIFQIDADEIPSEVLIDNIHLLLRENSDTDLFFIPRVNTVEGLTDKHIKKWGWKVNDLGYVNFPDYQTRIYRNTEDIEWEGNVHERIKGYESLSILPSEEIYCLYHHKDIKRQEKQNEYYQTL